MKFKQRVLNKSAKKAMVCTALIVGTISLTDFTKSYPKLYTEKESVISYKSDFLNLYRSEKTDIIHTTGIQTEEQARLKFTFNRNNLVDDNGIYPAETYTVKLAEDIACSIENISTKAKTIDENKASVNKDNNTVIISENSGDYETTVTMTCNLNDTNGKKGILVNDNGTSRLKTSVEIIEKVSEDVTSFTYKDYSLKLDYSEYLKIIEKIDENVKPDIIISKDNFENSFESFMKWLKSYSYKYYGNSLEIAKEIEDYGYLYYGKKGEKFNLDNPLPGLNWKYDESTGNCTIDINHSLLGHARTYKSYVSNMNQKNYMYFTPDATDEEINTTFEYYANYYLIDLYKTETSDGKESIDKIIEYVIKKGNISSVINGNSYINGIRNPEDNLIIVEKQILDYTTMPESTNPTMSIPITYVGTMYNEYFVGNEDITTGLTGLHGINIVRKNLIKYLYDMVTNKDEIAPIYYSVTKNGCTNGYNCNPDSSTFKSFTDYHILKNIKDNVTDKDEFILMKVYNPKVNETGLGNDTNFVELKAMEFILNDENLMATVGRNLNIKFVNTDDNKLNIELTVNKKTIDENNTEETEIQNISKIFEYVVVMLKQQFLEINDTTLINSDNISCDDTTCKYTYEGIEKAIVEIDKTNNDTSSEDNTPSNVSSGILSAKKPSLDINNDSNTENEESNTNTETNGNNNVADNNASDEKLNNGTQNNIPSTSDQTVTQSNTLSDTLKKVQEDQSTTKDNQISNFENNILQNEFENVSANVNEQ